MPFSAKPDDAIKRAVGQHPLEHSETGPADGRYPRDRRRLVAKLAEWMVVLCCSPVNSGHCLVVPVQAPRPTQTMPTRVGTLKLHNQSNSSRQRAHSMRTRGKGPYDARAHSIVWSTQGLLFFFLGAYSRHVVRPSRNCGCCLSVDHG